MILDENVKQSGPCAELRGTPIPEIDINKLKSEGWQSIGRMYLNYVGMVHNIKCY